MLNNTQYQLAADLAETTVYGASARSYMPGFPGGTVSVGGLFSGGLNEVDAVLNTALAASSATPMTILPEGYTTQAGTVRGRRMFAASVWDTSYSVTSPVNDVVAIAAEFSYDARMDTGWILDGQTAFSTTRAAAGAVSVDTTTTSSNGYVAHLHVTTNTRDAGSVTVSIHDSADNSAFALVTGATFSAVSAGSANISGQRLESTTQTVRRYVAANIAVTGGTTGSYTMVVVLAKRT